MASSQVTALGQAIAQAEGFGTPGAVPTLANNPGDITDTGWPGDTGRTMGAGIRVFATAADGWNALYGKLNNILAGGSSEYPLSLTFAEFGTIWAGGDPNWVNNVAGELGVDPSSTLAQFAGGAAASVIDVTPLSVSDGDAVPAGNGSAGSAGPVDLSTAVQNAVQNMNPSTWLLLTAGLIGAFILTNFLLDDE